MEQFGGDGHATGGAGGGVCALAAGGRGFVETPGTYPPGLSSLDVAPGADGAFVIHCEPTGDVTALVEKYRANPPANLFCNDSKRTKRLSFTWSPGAGAPREWLRLELTRTLLEPGSEEWWY